jgi:hypothetical protein
VDATGLGDMDCRPPQEQDRAKVSCAGLPRKVHTHSAPLKGPGTGSSGGVERGLLDMTGVGEGEVEAGDQRLLGRRHVVEFVPSLLRLLRIGVVGNMPGLRRKNCGMFVSNSLMVRPV